MTLKDLKKKATDLMPWSWGKRPVRVRTERAKSMLPVRQEDFRSGLADIFEDAFGGRFGERRLIPFAGPANVLGADWPHVDLEETDTQFTVTAEVPGLEAEDVKVAVDNNSLTISGAKTTQRKEHKRDYRLMETYSGSFHRTIPFPVEVDGDGVAARCRNGILTVTVPKAQSGRKAAKKIEVK